MTKPTDEHKRRRIKLMAARDLAIKRRDWAQMNEITRRLCKLPIPSVKK